MKLRSSVLALVALGALAAPVVAQTRFPGVEVFPLPTGGGPRATNVTTLTALLRSPSGQLIGKIQASQATVNGVLNQGVNMKVQGLQASTDYTLTLDGRIVGNSAAKADGRLNMKFLSPSRNGRIPALPASLFPITQAHEVAIYETSSQRLVASGTLVNTRGGGNLPK